MPDYTIFQLGDEAVTFSLGNSIRTEHHKKMLAMMHWIRRHGFPGLVDVIVAYSSLTVTYDLYLLQNSLGSGSCSAFVHDLILTAYNQSAKSETLSPALKRIP